MRRRDFLLGLGAGAVVVHPAFARVSCQTNGLVKFCTAGIRSGQIKQLFAKYAPAEEQLATQWCWAASISMVFAFHGHAVDQEYIVERIKGIRVNRPAHGVEISRALSRVWKDEDGDSFRSSCRVFDVLARRMELSNNDIIRELRADRPLIYGAAGHAMVLTAVQYAENQFGYREVRGGTVRDPWPGNGGRRQLGLPELVPMYVASVRIKEL